MKPRLLDSHSRHENESDYETAVDLRHYSIEEETRLYELSGLGCGVRIEIRVREIHTTGSYLEPDFDELEATGNLHYVSNRDDQVDEHTRYFRAEVLIPSYVRRVEDEEEFWAESTTGWDVYDLLPQALVERWVDEGADFEFPDNLAQELGQLYLKRVETNRRDSIERMCQEALRRIDFMADQALASLLFPEGTF